MLGIIKKIFIVFPLLLLTSCNVFEDFNKVDVIFKQRDLVNVTSEENGDKSRIYFGLEDICVSTFQFERNHYLTRSEFEYIVTKCDEKIPSYALGPFYSCVGYFTRINVFTGEVSEMFQPQKLKRDLIIYFAIC